MRSGLRVTLLALCATLASCNCNGKVLRESRSVISLDSNELDFGPVVEGTQKQLTTKVSNTGIARMQLMVSVGDGSSTDFALGSIPTLALEAGEHVDVPVVFTPHGPGEDVGTLVFSSDDPEQAALQVALHGGPIQPTLAFSPDPLDFTPATHALEKKLATLQNIGTANLDVRAVGVRVGGNPDFSVTPPMSLPVSLAPAQGVTVEVAYARSARRDEGALQVQSSDPDAGTRWLRLLPDPPPQCSDGVDDDGDGLVDFPDDPGCDGVSDDDEYNPPQCQTGATQPCGNEVGACHAGQRTCANALWGACDGGTRPTPEACNGIDDDCDGVTDQGVTELCMVNGCAGAHDCVVDAGGVFTACVPAAPAPEVCDGRDNDCDGTVDEGVMRACLVSTCAGTQVCVTGGTGTFDACVATSPQPETCNGVDDDCNGVIDDGITSVTCGAGACQRTGAGCVNGVPQMCTPGLPTAEVCNGVDDDCNGTADDGIAPLQCGVGICHRTAPACVGGAPGSCTPGAPAAETCNGLDDDCNAQVDDGLPNATCGVGACFRSVVSCAGGVSQPCTPGSPGTESCNGLDDDCDGLVDDGLPPATCGVGRCFRAVPSCVGGSAQSCTPGSPVSETCNALDDDCNGMVDDGLANATCGVGACFRSVPSCLGGVTQTCVPGAASMELCNGVDDDCDGTPDDGNPGGGAGCSTGQAGVCASGTVQCAAGALSCVRNVSPTAEVCNGLDDDCNVSVDDGDPGGGAACGTGQAGVCAAGTQHCVAGAVSCVRNVAPSGEVCDGLDNNCSGGVDEGDPGGGGACATGQAGVCSAGTQHCVSGSLSCVRNVAPSGEVCDGLDNNCSGAVDEGDPGGGAGCATGLAGVCAPGTQHCVSGAVACVQNALPTAEVCNGLDDNCAGGVDEGDPGGGGACATGLLGVCSAGVRHCMSGGLACVQTTMSSGEVCNGLDDNCSGATDEGDPGGGAACATGQAGVCAAGTQHCVTGSVSCVRNVAPSSEVCDGLDNNCAGGVDEGDPGGGGACATGLLGVCSAGVRHCVSGALACQQTTMAGAEVCGNGLDDDCDGMTDEGCAACNPLTMATWYQHHSYNPVTGLPVPKSASQFAQVEIGATRITPPAGAFPLTVTHVRVLGATGQTYTLRIYSDTANLPGAVLRTQSFVANGTYQVITLTTPLVLAAAASIWVGLQGAADGMTVYGDGNGEATLNYIYGCDLYFPPTCFGTYAWRTFNSYGPPFTAVDDLIIAVGQCL